MASSDGENDKRVSEPLVQEYNLKANSSSITPVYRGTASALLLSLPLVAFAIWLSFALKNDGKLNLISGNVIGGRLTQTEAKAIDFITGAIFGPVLIALLNYYWFTSAHVTVVNDLKPQNGVPLDALVEASSTTSGTFDLWKFYVFLRSKNRRLFLFTGLVLTSAIAKTAFSNIIAYEAYNIDDGRSLVSLRTLRAGAVSDMLFLNYTEEQEVDFGSQASAALTEMGYKGAAGKLDQDQYYIGVNATLASMDSLLPTILELRDVPSNRLSIECLAQPPDRVSVTAMGPLKVNWQAFFNETFFTAELPGPFAALNTTYNDEQQFVGYDLQKREVYLAFMNSFNLTTNPPIETPYGDITRKAYNMTLSGFTSTKSIMSAWGLRCRLYRENGLSNFTRDVGAPWKRSNSTFSGPKNPVKLRISEWQQSFNTKGAFFPGLAPAFANAALVCAKEDVMKSNCTTDYKTLANNFLCAAGELERIAYEVDSKNKNTTRAMPEDFFQVEATTRQQFYQITYVPIILIVGLVCVFFSALITGGLVVYSWRTQAFRNWREVSALRLLVDCVAGLKNEELNAIRDAENKELYKWGHQYKVAQQKREKYYTLYFDF